MAIERDCIVSNIDKDWRQASLACNNILARQWIASVRESITCRSSELTVHHDIFAIEMLIYICYCLPIGFVRLPEPICHCFVHESIIGQDHTVAQLVKGIF